MTINARAFHAPLLAATFLLGQPAVAREAKTVIMPTDAESLEFQNAVGFADGVITGDSIYLSGVVAAPRPGENGPGPAYERAFARLGETLRRAGAGWDDVVDLTTFHTDLPGQINAFVEVKNRFIKAPFPAWTAIGISTLYEPTAVTEIKIVARRPKR